MTTRCCVHCERCLTARNNSRFCRTCRGKTEIMALYRVPIAYCACGTRLSSDPRVNRDGKCRDCRAGKKVSSYVLRAVELSRTANVEGGEYTPGSVERLAVLIARVARGLPLWDKRDRLNLE